MFKFFCKEKILFQKVSKYNSIKVLEEGDRVKLILDETGNIHSLLIRGKPITYSYWDILIASPLFLKNPRNILILGYGAGTVARGVKIFFPEIEITGVEIDSEVVRLGHEFFEAPKVEVIIQDACEFVENNSKLYDIIISDIFLRSSIPESFQSEEFINKISKSLTDYGIFMKNFTNIKEATFFCEKALALKSFEFTKILKSPESMNFIVLLSKRYISKDSLIKPDNEYLLSIYYYITSNLEIPGDFGYL